MRPIIDSHLDLSWSALSWNRDLTLPLEEIRRRERHMTDDDARGNATVSLPELRRANVLVCLATLLVRAKPEVVPPVGKRIDLDYASLDHAHAIAMGQLAYYHELQRRGELRMLSTRSALRAFWDEQRARSAAGRPVGAILAMEGADPITSPAQVEHWWALGLRSVMLAHYGKSHYAVGTGDAGPLTTAGVEILKEFERVGMILDLTHTSDPSFFEALERFRGPVMASHNNCRALVPGDRQFSDEQIRLLAERGAVIGVVCDQWMLAPGYRPGSSPRIASLTALADQIDHICQLTGSVRHAAIGSDLDGGFGTEQSPSDLETITDLHKLDPILRGRGYSDADLDAIFFDNWLQFFLRHLP